MALEITISRPGCGRERRRQAAGGHQRDDDRGEPRDLREREHDDVAVDARRQAALPEELRRLHDPVGVRVVQRDEPRLHPVLHPGDRRHHLDRLPARVSSMKYLAKIATVGAVV
jgi:hypothetical protein